MNVMKTFKNNLFEVEAKIEGEIILFDVEQVAKCLGITSKTTKNGITYENVRWTRVNEYIGHLLPQVAEIQKGDLIPEPLVYKLAFKASNEVAEQFQDWLAIEVIPSIRKTGQYSALSNNGVTDFEKHLIGVKYATEILRVDDSSKVRMLEAAHKEHGVPTNHLPDYVDEELKVSLTQLLKEHGVKMGAAAVNTKLIEMKILEIKERPSSKGNTKEFKSLTEKGLYYGSNAISPYNSKETQPMYYPSKFTELIDFILDERG